MHTKTGKEVETKQKTMETLEKKDTSNCEIRMWYVLFRILVQHASKQPRNRRGHKIKVARLSTGDKASRKRLAVRL